MTVAAGEAAYRALDPGWQRAAEYLAQGLSETEAHARAFPESRATRKSRCDLMRRARSEKVGFQAAVDWLVAKGTERGIIDVERWWSSATEIHDFDPRKLVLLMRGKLDPADMTEAEVAAICGWTERYDPVTGAVVSRSIKVTPRKDVLALVGPALKIADRRDESAADLVRELARLTGMTPEEVAAAAEPDTSAHGHDGHRPTRRHAG